MAVASSDLYMRNGCVDFLKTIKSEGLKLHIVSAGTKAVVTESFYILEMQREIDLSDTLVYCMTSEFYDITQSNALVDFGKPTIMSTNKHLCVNHTAYPEIKEGTNAIVMGDLIEDYLIVQNLRMKEVVGIGFMNITSEYNPEKLKKFTEVFDIVIIGDGNLNCVTELIKSIIGQPVTENHLNPTHTKFSKFLLNNLS